jgi:hypothetical protein
MKSTLLSALAAAVVVASGATMNAQTKTLTGEAKTITATVEAIEASTRTLTVKGPEGNYVPITVPASVERFSDIKVGDTISARYYDNIVLRLKPAGEPAVDSAAQAVTKGTAGPAGTAAKQRTITATIVAIDNNVPSITFKGEKVNWNYSSRVEDKAALAKVKVGDRVDITWTEAVTVSVVKPAKKH